MTSVLIAAVVLVGALGAVNLVLVLAVVRRLRGYEERLAPSPPPADRQVTYLPAGTPVPSFEADLVGGGSVTSRDLATGQHLVAFVSPDCLVCREQIPALVGYAERSIGLDQLLVVVVEPNGEDLGIVGQHPQLGRVVSEANGTGLNAGFEIQVFPTIYLFGDGLVTASVHNVERLPVPADA